ncbi:MAG TPA: Lsr2 family protein [Microlunatus sp.]|nr:Lsr2 family protein [Microlunatus sp.]
MVRRVEIKLEDDLDGSEADETVTFSLDGVDYEIDLSADNANKLRATLQEFVERARQTGTRRDGISTFVTELPPANSTIRAWAQSNGYRIPDRGRIPTDIRQAYDEATRSSA